MIYLRPKTEDEYGAYLKLAILNYAKEKEIGEGHTSENAFKIALESFSSLLPDGLQTSNQFIYSITEKESEKMIGTLWIAKRTNLGKDYAYIYDIMLDENVRGKGYGKLLMNLVEEEVKKKNLKTISLHVFGHNKVARALYLKSGYIETNVMMKKDL